MPHPEREHSLQIEVARLTRALEEAQTDAANLRFVNDKVRKTCAAANARADAAESANTQLAILLRRADAETLKAQEALAAARRECEAMRAILVSALYEDGYCEMTTSGKLLEPQGHAPGCDSDPPHRCVCWVMKAYALAAPAAAAGEEGTR